MFPRKFNMQRSRQKGVVLLISLIVLVALTMAGIALVRSTDTGSVISGNAAFRMSALHAVDTGVETAFGLLSGPSGYAQTPNVGVSAPSGQYFPTINDADGDGLPNVTWSSIGSTTVDGNTIRWVAERLCTTNVTLAQRAETEKNCENYAFMDGDSNSQRLAPRNPILLVGYRITVRVEGPRNTVVMSQSIVGI